MSPRRQPADHLRRARGWLIPAACVIAAPKCVLCLLAYAGLGATLGFGGPELCGATNVAPGLWPMWLFATGITLGLVGIFCRWRRYT